MPCVNQDAIRLFKMVHASKEAERMLVSMIRYGQQCGNDAVCKAIILNNLGEPDRPNLDQVMRDNADTTTLSRDVGWHAQTLLKLLLLRTQEGTRMTMAMLVRDWRASPSTAEQWYDIFGLLEAL
jgi:hypothetical protein